MAVVVRHTHDTLNRSMLRQPVLGRCWVAVIVDEFCIFYGTASNARAIGRGGEVW